MALTLTLALAAVIALVAIAVLTVEPKPIAGLEASQRQGAESALYVAALAIVLLSVLAVPRLARAVTSGPNAGGLSPLAALFGAGLAGVVLMAHSVDRLAGGGTEVLLATTVAWAVTAAVALARAASPRPWPPLLALARRARALWWVAGALALATPLVVTDFGSLSPIPLVLGAIAVLLCSRLAERGGVPALRGRRGAAVDVGVIALLLLLVPDLVVIRPEDPALPPFDRFIASIMQFHHDFLVGPANQVLGGDALLRDTASQYGVGSIYFLAGWFDVMTVSYGSLALLDGVLTAALLACAYAVLRIAGCSRPLAASALAVAVIALVFNRQYPVGSLPQEGPFRFGLPMAVILAMVAGARWPRRLGATRAVALTAVGVSSIWSLEAFASVAATFGALVCFEGYMRPAGDRLRWFARQTGVAAAACVAAHLFFAVATLAGTGDLPDWGQYLAFLDAFLFSDLGDLTYDFSRWSAGLALGAAYLASGVALLLLLARSTPQRDPERRVFLTALTGVSAYGVVSFAYFVDRSADHVVVYVALPAVMAGALWLGLLLGSRDPLPRGSRGAAVAIAASVAVLLVSVGWSSVERPLRRSALAQLVPGGDSLRGAVARLRAFPAIDARAPEGERLLDRYMPGEDKSVVLVEPDLTVEILIRRGRANALPLSNPREDDFTFDERLPGILEAVAQLKPGRRILVDAPILSALATVRRDPASPLLEKGAPASSALELHALRAIDRRFRLRALTRGAGGLVVLELGRRRET